MALGVHQPHTGQTIGVSNLVFSYSYLYGKIPLKSNKMTTAACLNTAVLHNERRNSIMLSPLKREVHFQVTDV